MGISQKLDRNTTIHTMNTQFEQQFQPFIEMMQANMPGLMEQMKAGGGGFPCGKRGKWANCSTSKSQDSSNSSNTIRIPLMRFNADQVNLNMNAKGLLTVTASKEETNDTKRNGQRKVTTMIEETCQMPGYVVDKDLLKQVESKFEHGHLVVTLPEDPAVVEKQEEEKKANGPVDI